MGEVSGPYGVQGWIKVNSYTEDPGAILDYPQWKLGLTGGWQDVDVVEGRRHGKSVVARLAGCADRDEAAALAGASVAIDRTQLPQLDADEFYWTDLEGLDVVNTSGTLLGRVISLMETGANDVLVVSNGKETLIPSLPDVIRSVDLQVGRIVADWEPDY